MKKITLTIMLAITGLAVNAQNYHINPIIYEPTFSSSRSVEEDTPTQTIYGYKKTSSGWVRISLKVKELHNYIVVVGYKDKNTSSYIIYNENQWHRCHNHAQSVSSFDSQEIINNFDYKVKLPCGYVYF